jgi:hypothetical protein
MIGRFISLHELKHSADGIVTDNVLNAASILVGGFRIYFKTFVKNSNMFGVSWRSFSLAQDRNVSFSTSISPHSARSIFFIISAQLITLYTLSYEKQTQR